MCVGNCSLCLGGRRWLCESVLLLKAARETVGSPSVEPRSVSEAKFRHYCSYLQIDRLIVVLNTEMPIAMK
jgi:hypothetical protein